MRGLVCGLMNALDGIGDTLPFMIPAFRAALTAASTVVVVELGVSPGFATASGNSAAFRRATSKPRWRASLRQRQLIRPSLWKVRLLCRVPICVIQVQS